MKKIVSLILAAVLALSLGALAGCGKTEGTDADKTIRIGASSTPHAEILEQVKQTLADQGYTLDIVVYDDYILPNKGVTDGELDANYFQHVPYLDSYNESNGTNIVSAGKVHYEPFGLYGKGVTTGTDVAAGATIIIPADDSNETRALFLLQQEGYIKLAEGSTVENGVTTLDIVDNGGFNVVAVSAETVASQLANSEDGTLAVINGNYAIGAGLKIADALATEDSNGDAAQYYANIIAVNSGNENLPKIKALVEALHTDAVKQYITDTYAGAVVSID